MTWDHTLLLVHLAELFALAALYRHCPDLAQRVVLLLLAAAALAFVGVYAAQIGGHWVHWMWKRLGHEIEHIAVMLYLFRLFIVDQERRCLPSFSAPSRSSLPS